MSTVPKAVDVHGSSCQGILDSSIPEGMRQVTKDEFWTAVNAETRNIHPRSERLHTDWYLVNTNKIWGWSSRGFSRSPDRHGQEEVFALVCIGGAP